MKIGIYGGAFNPPHKMHQKIAEELLSYVDKVIVVPIGDQYQKPFLLKGTDRLKMFEELVNENPQIEVSDFEVRGSLYTINLLNHFHELYLKDELYFVCGTDDLAGMDTWKHYEEILSRYQVIVITRGKENFDEIIQKFQAFSNHIHHVSIKTMEISSTKIREEIMKHGFTKKLEEYLDNRVITYLKNINLSEYWSEKNEDIKK